MKGIILAGGTGSRLRPLTLVSNKHLLPVGNKPMIMHSIFKLTEAGIVDIMIVTGSHHAGPMTELLGSGKKFGCNISFRIQDSPDGIGGALILCKDFVGDDDVVVILGDNIFQDKLENCIKVFNKNKEAGASSCVLNLKKVSDPHRFGVAFLKDKKITKIVEKPNPENLVSDMIVTGIYVYDKKVFDIIKKTKISSRGEFEITEVNNFYVNNGKVNYNILNGWWIDAGTFSSYQKANNLINNL